MTTSFRIVVIEDNASISELVDETLTDEGYEVFRVPRGRGAAEVVAATSPHLVLLDRHLGDCDAAHVLEDLRARPSLAHIPVVLMSASATVYSEAAELGVTGALAKPFLLDTLVACVATYMSQVLRERYAGA